MDQPTFAELEFRGKKRKTRRELFLERMDGLIPWQRLEERIRPVYLKAGKGRQPYPLAVMLRIHCVQLFYNLSDPGMEDPRLREGGFCSMRPNRCAGSLV
jgi:IS5 family transposase